MIGVAAVPHQVLALSESLSITTEPQSKRTLGRVAGSKEPVVTLEGANAVKPVSQIPETHTWPVPQASLQALQCASPPRAVSQPVASRPSQSSKPASQAPIWQAPVAQLASALGSRPEASPQGAPQALQSARVWRLVSQLWPSPSQSANGALQDSAVQTPPAQLSSAVWGSSQGTAQAPQSLRVSSGVSQPLSASSSQSPKPGSQAVSSQLPVAQLVRAWASWHVLSHSLQLTPPVHPLPPASAEPPVELPAAELPAAPPDPDAAPPDPDAVPAAPAHADPEQGSGGPVEPPAPAATREGCRSTPRLQLESTTPVQKPSLP
jgi:hypothetical protein